ncbi:MAG TPA: 2'-5' RNA ligase family protein [Verrucomicrobiae bacterium]|jgi:2'-5' RNA ligase|nr:2'-5' RNA ligase family protein [Verrucomicrobiae bacterium]
MKRLQQLYAEITGATQTFGEPPEDRPFTPHLTLARVKQFERSSAPALEAMRGFQIENPWVINEAVFKKATPKRAAGP